MKNLILVTMILFNFNSAWAYRSQDTQVLAECEWNKELYNLKADCNDLYHHYLPKKDKYQPTESTVRLGSFNIYKMGYSDAKFKRLDLIAQLIQARWDVVALSEIQHNASSNLKYNVNALRALDKGIITKKVALQGYTKPAYLKLLHHLQELDPTWGLILSPFGQNPNAKSPSDEMYAFLYRKSQVRPKESKYCQQHLYDRLAEYDGRIPLYKWMSLKALKGVEKIKADRSPNLEHNFVRPRSKAIACLLNLKGDEQKYFPRIPLTASFESNGFDFSYFTLHLRFRSPDTVATSTGPKCKEACQTTLTKMAKAAGAPAHFSVKKLSQRNSHPRISGSDMKEIARMFETFVTLKAAKKLREINNDNDVIIAGDFNLASFDLAGSNVTSNLSGTSGELISVLDALPHAKSYNTKKTSISKKFGIEGRNGRGGGNSYDHFILVNKSGYTSECDINSARRVDFVKDRSVKKQMKILGQNFDEYYENPDNFDEIISWTLNSFFTDRVRIDRTGKIHKLDSNVTVDNASGDLISKYNNCISGQKKQKMTLVEGVVMDLRCQLLWHSQYSNKNMLSAPNKPKTREQYRIYTGTMSDHVPIEMTCSAPINDDD